MEGASLHLRRGGPLGRPAGAGLVVRPFLANSDCLPAVRPGGRTLRSAGLRHPTVSHRKVHGLTCVLSFWKRVRPASPKDGAA